MRVIKTEVRKADNGYVLVVRSGANDSTLLVHRVYTDFGLLLKEMNEVVEKEVKES